MSLVEMMFLPFLAAVVLSGIHAYFGLHVLDRGVVFVDLALAQMAALGAVCAILWGIDIHGNSAFYISLGFTMVGSLLFSWTRPQDKRVPHEAIIGIIYVVTTAATILVLDRAPKESEHIKHMLVGNILFIHWGEFVNTVLLYGLVAGFHFYFRQRFLDMTNFTEEMIKRGISVKLWDFLFYLTFGIVVTSSVRIAGVLLVFSYLIVTAVIGTVFSQRRGVRLMIGWGSGVLASFLGMGLSALLDFPTGAMIVVMFGVLLLGSFIVKKLFMSACP